MDIATPRADIAPEDVEVDEGGSKRRRVGAVGDGRPLNVHGIDGSTFQLLAVDGTTVDDLYRIIRESAGMKPGSRLVLTSGGKVLDASKPLLQQVDGDEIMFVVRQIAAGEAAVSLLRALAEAKVHSKQFPLLAADVDAINAITSLTLDFDQSLDGVALPSGLQRLTFGSDFNQSLDGVTLPSGLQTLTFNFNQSLDGVTLPSGLQTLTLDGEFNQKLGWCNAAQRLAELDLGLL
ncbi:unnamed protein product [Durusdinium trenchii]|uniref:Ubiquitin-like domain-containing protein n=1 Tax=Durusdinium trenchii TaxID=1381693 RepID=A0ABP0QAU0_9DINO